MGALLSIESLARCARTPRAPLLNLASILMVVFILGQATLYVDLAKSAVKMMHVGVKTASLDAGR